VVAADASPQQAALRTRQSTGLTAIAGSHTFRNFDIRDATVPLPAILPGG